jgi:hypothetical protein
MGTLIGLALAYVAYKATVRTGLVVVLCTIVLIPNGIALKGTKGVLPYPRLVLVGFLLGIIVGIWRGEIPLDALRPRRIHAAIAALLAIAWWNGVVVTQAGNSFLESSLTWLSLVDQLLTFVAILAACRILGVWRVARIVAFVFLAAACIAVFERITTQSWSRKWAQLTGTPGRQLGRRLGVRGEVRVRGAFQFALEMAWAFAIAMPVVTAVFLYARRRIKYVVPLLMVAGVLFTVSRSAPAGIALGLVALAILTRGDRRVVGFVLIGAVAAGMAVLAQPSLLPSYDEARADSADTRVRRLAILTDQVSERPYEGLGLAGLREQGIGGTDSSYSFYYAALGVPGLLAHVVVMLTLLATVLVGVRSKSPPMRLIVAASVGGILAGILGDFATNIFFVSGASKTFWIIAALGVAAAETTHTRAARVRPLVPVRALLPVAGVVAGLLVSAAVPSHIAATYRLSSISINQYLRVPKSPAFVEKFLLNTACGIASNAPTPHTTLDCRDLRELGAVRILRLESDTRAHLDVATETVITEMRKYFPGLQVSRVSFASGEPTIARTASFWLGGLGLAVALLVPPRRWRRRDGPRGGDDAAGDAGPAPAPDAPVAVSATPVSVGTWR